VKTDGIGRRYNKNLFPAKSYDTLLSHAGGKYKTPDLLSSKFFVKDVIKEARIYREI